jgi:hypothetical protein
MIQELSRKLIVKSSRSGSNRFQLGNQVTLAHTLEKTRGERFWYRAYCTAMLQTDADRVFQEVEFARKAIQDRVAELNRQSSESPRERRELHEASHYLSLLLDCSLHEGGRLLWC